MAGHAELRDAVVHDQELGKPLFMGIMAGGALEPPSGIEPDLPGKGGGVSETTLTPGQARVIDEGNGMVVRKISPEGHSFRNRTQR
jgi:hypothetical protein